MEERCVEHFSMEIFCKGTALNNKDVKVTHYFCGSNRSFLPSFDISTHI